MIGKLLWVNQANFLDRKRTRTAINQEEERENEEQAFLVALLLFLYWSYQRNEQNAFNNTKLPKTVTSGGKIFIIINNKNYHLLFFFFCLLCNRNCSFCFVSDMCYVLLHSFPELICKTTNNYLFAFDYKIQARLDGDCSACHLLAIIPSQLLNS